MIRGSLTKGLSSRVIKRVLSSYCPYVCNRAACSWVLS